MASKLQGLLLQRWKVYSGNLRSGFSVRIIEIQTVDGQAVIPWAGFDNCDISYMERAMIARAIVRQHNTFLALRETTKGERNAE
jgi:hypothetical protein